MIPGATIVGIPCKISVGFTAGFWLKPPLFSTKESFFFSKKTHVQDGNYVMVYKPTNITGGGPSCTGAWYFTTYGSKFETQSHPKTWPKPNKNHHSSYSQHLLNDGIWIYLILFEYHIKSQTFLLNNPPNIFLSDLSSRKGMNSRMVVLSEPRQMFLVVFTWQCVHTAMAPICLPYGCGSKWKT